MGKGANSFDGSLIGYVHRDEFGLTADGRDGLFGVLH